MNKIFTLFAVAVIFCFLNSSFALAKFETISAENASQIIEKNKPEKFPFDLEESITLKDGNILVLKSMPVESELNGKIIKELIRGVLWQKYNKLQATNSVNEPFTTYVYKYMEKYVDLSEEEKEKIYLPLIKQLGTNNENYKKYLINRGRRIAVENAKIYDVKTKKLKKVGKRTIQEEICSEYTTLLNDGRVLIGYNPPEYYGGYPNTKLKKIKLEVYIPETESFKRLKDLDNATIIHIFDNGKILIQKYQEPEKNKYINIKTAIYDINSETTTYIDKSIDTVNSTHHKLKDGRILLFTKGKNRKTYVPDIPKFKTLKDLNNAKITHIDRKNNSYIITDGENNTKRLDINNGTITPIDKTINDLNSNHYTKVNDSKIVLKKGINKIEQESNRTILITFFNPKDNSITETDNEIDISRLKFSEEKENTIYIASGQKIYELNTKNNSLKQIGEMIIKRSKHKIDIINNSIYYYNGDNMDKCDINNKCAKENSLEIFNTKTKKNTIINSSHNWQITPLTNKRVLLYSGKIHKGLIYTED